MDWKGRYLYKGVERIMQRPSIKPFNEEEYKKEREEHLIRSGNIVNTLGIIRAAHINGGTITKEHFTNLVKRNYNFTGESLTSNLVEKIDEVWVKAISVLGKMKWLASYETNQIVIRIGADPPSYECHEIEKEEGIYERYATQFSNLIFKYTNPSAEKIDDFMVIMESYAKIRVNELKHLVRKKMTEYRDDLFKEME